MGRREAHRLRLAFAAALVGALAAASFAQPKPFKSQAEEEAFHNRFHEVYAEIGQAYRKVIAGFNPRLAAETVDQIARSIIFYTLYFNRNEKVPIDPRLVIAVIKTESDFRLGVISRSGAMGLGQLMPATARAVGLNREHAFHPVYNVYGTVRVLRMYFNRWQHLPYPQQYLFAIASYNAGPNAVAKYGGVPPYRETQDYVRKVTDVYRRLAPELFAASP